MFNGKNVLIGITGGISAYKVNFLIRELVKLGVETKIVLTKSAEKFVSILTLKTLSKNEVHLELFPEKKETEDYCLAKNGMKCLSYMPLYTLSDKFFLPVGFKAGHTAPSFPENTTKPPLFRHTSTPPKVKLC